MPVDLSTTRMRCHHGTTRRFGFSGSGADPLDLDLNAAPTHAQDLGSLFKKVIGKTKEATDKTMEPKKVAQ
ncbi:MAG: hypothetical protein IPN59_02210 [Holophaga sp.]|nr:hypothetical protein [Holophaga sp.]